MGAQGTAILDFGAFPGASDASVVVTGQASILSGSLVEAWIQVEASADHTADEHMVETLKVFAHSIVAGTGFTISGFNTNQINEPLTAPGPGISGPVAGTVRGGVGPSVGGGGTRLYGKFNVNWVWN